MYQFHRPLILALVVLLTACTSTPQGKAIDRAQYADIASTLVAQTVEGAAEANPLGLAVLPIKLFVGYLIETKLDKCSDRVDAADVLNTGSYAFTANNLAVLAGVSGAPLVGIAGGLIYWLFKEDLEPETYFCPDPNWIRGGPNQLNMDLVIPI